MSELWEQDREGIMVDISKCRDINCHIKGRCFRYLAKPDEYCQSYFSSSPRDQFGCKEFMDIKKMGVSLKKDNE